MVLHDPGGDLVFRVRQVIAPYALKTSSKHTYTIKFISIATVEDHVIHFSASKMFVNFLFDMRSVRNSPSTVNSTTTLKMI